MFCPECGNDAGDAKFCPECGTQLEQVRAAVKGPGATGARAANGARTTSARAPKAPRADQPSQVQAPSQPASGMQPLYLWLGVLAVAIVAVVLVVALTYHKSSTSTAVDTSGTYSELVARANALYDKGTPYVDKGDFTTAATYYNQAAQLYQAAWQKQPGDPGVGTDFATSLFYAGDVQGAIVQVRQVLKTNPTYQNALFNLGNYLSMQGRQLVSNGQTTKGQKLLAEAKANYAKAVKADPTSQSGQAAATAIKGLSQITPSPSASSTP